MVLREYKHLEELQNIDWKNPVGEIVKILDQYRWTQTRYKIRWKDWPEVRWIAGKYLYNYEKEITEYKNKLNKEQINRSLDEYSEEENRSSSLH